jgi:hypothetical protein
MGYGRNATKLQERRDADEEWDLVGRFRIKLQDGETLVRNGVCIVLDMVRVRVRVCLITIDELLTSYN